jgi:plasmid stabilization system protein ParE
MRVRWTLQARSDLVRLYEFLAAVNPKAAARVLQRLQAAPGSLRDHPRLGARLGEFSPREVRRLFVDDYELRYEIQRGVVIVLALWHTKEDR